MGLFTPIAEALGRQRWARSAEYYGRAFTKWRHYHLRLKKPRMSYALPAVGRGSSGVSMVAICRDEGPFIREWVEFHAGIGFDRFLVYDNGSTDETLDELSSMAREHDITVVQWPDFIEGANAQEVAYNHAIATLGATSSWVAFIDLDEFLFPLEPVTIAKALEDFEEMPSVSVPWYMFGTSGHVERPRGRVTENFVMRAPFPPPVWKNTLLHYKSIVRPDRVARMTIHFPDLIGEPAHFYTERKERVHKAKFADSGLASSEIFRLNHYFSRSQDDFEAKMVRGPISRRNRSTRKRDRFEQIEDETIRDDTAVGKWRHF